MACRRGVVVRGPTIITFGRRQRAGNISAFGMTLGRPIDLRLAREIVLAWLNKVPIEAMLDDDVMARELRPPNGDEIREAFRVLYAGYTMLALRVVDDWLLPPTTRHPVLLDIAVFPRMGRWMLLRSFVTVWRDGKLPTRPIAYRGARIEITADHALSVHADGAPAGGLPAEFVCRKGALAVYS